MTHKRARQAPARATKAQRGADSCQSAVEQGPGACHERLGSACQCLARGLLVAVVADEDWLAANGRAPPAFVWCALWLEVERLSASGPAEPQLPLTFHQTSGRFSHTSFLPSLSVRSTCTRLLVPCFFDLRSFFFSFFFFFLSSPPLSPLPPYLLPTPT